jgi:hypothetical protein
MGPWLLTAVRGVLILRGATGRLLRKSGQPNKVPLASTTPRTRLVRAAHGAQKTALPLRHHTNRRGQLSHHASDSLLLAGRSLRYGSAESTASPRVTPKCGPLNTSIAAFRTRSSTVSSTWPIKLRWTVPHTVTGSGATRHASVPIFIGCY